LKKVNTEYHHTWGLEERSSRPFFYLSAKSDFTLASKKHMSFPIMFVSLSKAIKILLLVRETSGLLQD